MKYLSVNVHGVNAKIQTDNDKYYSFVENNYLIFKKKFNIKSKCQICSIFSKAAGKYAKKKKKNLIKISEGFYIGNASVYWENEFGFCIFIEFSNKNFWKIYSYHFDLQKKLNLEDEYKNFMRSMRWSIHFPIFVLLDYLKGIKLVHASAISNKKKTILFCGLNKVGKSSLALFFFKNLKFKIISDNFLLIGKNTVYAFPEMSRVSPQSVKKLKLEINNKNLIYGKYHLPIPKKNILDQVSSNVHVYIVANSKKEKIKEIKREKAILLIESMHNYLQEFPCYTFYSVLDFFGFNNKNKKGMDIFSEKTKFYILSHKMNWDYRSLCKKIIKKNEF